MKTTMILLAGVFAGLLTCSDEKMPPVHSDSKTDSIVRVEMHLSAFGVESDHFPSIDVLIDVTRDTSICTKSYYNPAYRGSTYSLTKSEIRSVLALLESVDLDTLDREYQVSKTDQPRSITTVHTKTRTIVVDDYGLEGDYPLQEIYDIAYRY